MTPEAQGTTSGPPRKAADPKLAELDTQVKALAKSESRLPAVAFDYGDDAGGGFENQTVADISMPLVMLLQPLSPEVAEKRVEGAAPGDLYNTVTHELYGQEIYVVPCFTERQFIEFVPRDAGGGFRGAHQPDSDVVRAAQREAAAAGRKFGRGYLVREATTQDGVEKRELQETYAVYAFRLDSPESNVPGELVVIPFSSTKIPVYKDWMTQLRSVAGRPPLWSFRCRIESFDDKNKKGQSYKNYRVAPALGRTWAESLVPKCLAEDKLHPLYEYGRTVNDQCKTGLARATYETMATDEREPGEEAPINPKTGKAVF